MSDQEPIIIRSSLSTAFLTNDFKGQPSLYVSFTNQYNWLYNDKGSGARADLSVFRPNPSDKSYFIVGDYAQGNHRDPTGSSLIIKEVNGDPRNPILKAPSDYTLLWNDRGTGGRYDGSCWKAVAPDGYLALGFVFNNSYGKPNIPNYVCIRKDFVTGSSAGSQIWNDAGTGISNDLELFELGGVSGAFVAQANHQPYTGTAYKLIVT
ncbi:Vps62-related protein [Mucilaginibacter sp. ZT4R22]|uniref:Vps62-related protein n=1 Tax=Mucilaginibacter pankratovii TaxID=2772110 RepID=A0ABR7WP73_9SPHI|nr:Vps62-related protein [Mucilaginibacter pankratovii]MBD1364111.1 Vps62-related protein [Mucilaginibacter pankratovii]